MDERTKLGVLGAVAGFAVAAAFGIGLISMAVFLRGDSVRAADTAVETESHVMEVHLKDLVIEPPRLEARPGPITIQVSNEGQAAHNFALEGAATPMLQPGESATALRFHRSRRDVTSSCARWPATPTPGCEGR
jgi:plastocyanin